MMDSVLSVENEAGVNSSFSVQGSKLNFCLHHLVGFDVSGYTAADDLTAASRENAQIFIEKIVELPMKTSADGTFAQLPLTPTFLLPRKNPIPPEKSKTRWQKFAEMKGIQSRKRSRIVWDELKKDWVPRWGHNSVKKNEDKLANVLIEVKPGADLSVNPFDEVSRNKQLQRGKQKIRELKNKMAQTERSSFSRGGAGMENQLPTGVANLQPDVMNRKTSKRNVEQSLKMAQMSTRSYGREDPLLPHEDRKKIRKKTKTVGDYEGKGLASERSAYMKMMQKISAA